MPQTDPGTRKPGRLVIRYAKGSIEHFMGANFQYPNDFSNLSAIRDEAQLFAEAAASMCANTVSFTDWKIVDNDGAELYGEPLTTIVVGALAVDNGRVTSESTTLAAHGKGAASDVGIKRGNTRTFVFTGYIRPSDWTDSQILPLTDGYDPSLIGFLNDSDLVGADFFGQKAVYQDNYDVQINAHYQKKYGL